MEDNIKSLLKFPSDFSEDGLKDLAQEIMNNICISNGRHKYQLLEIEFYLYLKDVSENEERHADEHVYARDAEAGQFFLHQMGIDICFDSSMSEGRFGGILIRAIQREDGQCFGGPRICSYELINTATKLCTIEKSEEKSSYLVDTSPRIGIKDWSDSESKWEDKYYNKSYRFVRQGLKEIKTDVKKYDFIDTKPKTQNKTYKF